MPAPPTVDDHFLRLRSLLMTTKQLAIAGQSDEIQGDATMFASVVFLLTELETAINDLETAVKPAVAGLLGAPSKRLIHFCATFLFPLPRLTTGVLFLSKM
jgi:hypothetical protein